MNKWVRANNWVGQHLFYVVVSAVALGLFFPISKFAYVKQTTIGIFAYITFITSLGTGFRTFIRVMKTPLIPLWILFLLHFAVPVAAWGIGNLFYPGDAAMRMGLLINASIPLAVTSILWTSIAGGNIAISIMSVTLDTMIAPLLLPLFFMVVVGTAIEINYASMIIQLFGMVTIPSLSAMLITDATKGKLDNFAKGMGGLTSRLALFFVVFFNATAVAPEIVWSLAMAKTLFVVFLLVISGYFIGFLGSFVFKTRSKEIVMTMVYSVGMRNISFGLVLAMAYFPISVAIPVILATIFQQPTAALISYIYKRFSR